MRRRTSIEIIGEILSLCRQPQTKTRIMYQTNLSWKVSEKYLSKLQSRGLLQIHHSYTKYATTKKGIQFLGKCVQLTEFLYMRSKKDIARVANEF